ncbi:MAG: ATPase, T2SS/T4P/T4SS family [Bdellovibrionota bacterium]
MSKDGERDTLLDLFSTRTRSSTLTDGDPLADSGSFNAGGGNRRDTRHGTGARVTLSPIANAVLRETRRELGSQETLDDSKDVSEEAIAKAIDKVCASRGFVIDDIVRADIIVHLKRDLLGWGVLQTLIDNPEVTDIHCYDFQTVVLQRGKMSETTGIHWPSHETYCTFIDRILFRLGKSLSTQQHTVDASFPDGKRICAVHESVCGSRGPMLTIRVPRVTEATLESLVSYQVAPPLIVNYLAALVRTCEHTFMVAGETGTGKTTLMRCLGTQFRSDEAIIGVEDTPELNYQHPYYRSLVSRTANTEGVGEVTLQEHIKTTLRLCPTRVILGEMRTPEAAEAFLESAQTGHCGMSTVHARNARETLTRLESLLGRAQRGVSMDIIRQQIALAVDVVCWNIRERGSGRVRLAEVMEVGHFVEGNIQVRPMFKLVHQGENPQWEVQSYSSYYEEVLERNGIYLGDSPKYLGFNNQSSSTVAAVREAGAVAR